MEACSHWEFMWREVRAGVVRFVGVVTFKAQAPAFARRPTSLAGEFRRAGRRWFAFQDRRPD